MGGISKYFYMENRVQFVALIRLMFRTSIDPFSHTLGCCSILYSAELMPRWRRLCNKIPPEETGEGKIQKETMMENQALAAAAAGTAAAAAGPGLQCCPPPGIEFAKKY